MLCAMDENDRPKGFLSHNPESDSVSDREFLDGDIPDEKADDDNWKSTRRGRIRQRTEGAIFDFGLLFDKMDPTDRDLIFTGNRDQPNERGPNPFAPNQDLSDVEGDFEWDFLSGWKSPDFRPAKGDEELIHAVADAIAFLWLGCHDAHVNPGEVMEKGIERAYEKINRSHLVADVSVVPEGHINDREAMAERGREKMAKGEKLISAEAYALVQNPRVPHSAVFEYLRGEIDEYELPELTD